MSYDTDTCPKWTDHPMFDLHPSVLEVQAAKNVRDKTEGKQEITARQEAIE